MERGGHAFISRPVDIAILAILAAAAAWSLLSLGKLEFDPDMAASLPNSAEQAQYKEANALFPDERLVIASLPCGDPFAQGSLDRLKALSAALEAGTASGAWKAYGPTTVEDFVRRGDELVSEPLYGPASSAAELRARLGASPLLSRLFLSSDGKAWTILLAAKAEDEALIAALDSLRSAFPELKFAGMPYYRAHNHLFLLKEFAPLFALAAAVLLAFEFLILRAAGPALLLWACSFLPALLLMGLFVLTGTPVRLQYVLAPVLTLSLSNSYVTHMYRGWAELGFSPRVALRSRAYISLLDAGTTVLGFGSLFTSPMRELVVLGAFCIAGAALSLVAGLVALPAALGLVSRPSAAARRFATVEEAPKPRRPARAPWLAALAAACLALGILSSRVQSGFEARDFFLPWSDKAREASYFDASYEGLDEIALVIRSGRENGIVDLGFFRSLDALQRDISALPGVSSVYGPNDLVKEALARWEGRPTGEVEPRSEADIGESLQLLSGAAGGLFSRGFVDPSWSCVKIRISVSPAFNPYRDFPLLKAKATESASARLPGATFLWAGEIVGLSIDQRAYIQGQASGGAGFFALLFVGLCLVFRSIPRALAVSIVPATGFLACFGLMGLFGWRLSAVHAIALATIAGTGVDSAILLVLRDWSPEARSGAIDASLLIVISMAALLLCSSFLVVQTTLICMAGLVASTACAVFVLPAFGNIKPKDNRPF